MGTILVVLIILAIVALAIFSIVKDKKNGKSTCGNNCCKCPMSGQCHKYNKDKK